MTVHRLPDRNGDEHGILLPEVEVVDALGPEDLIDFLARAGALIERARARLAMVGARPGKQEPGDADKLLTADDAAEKLGTTADWLYRLCCAAILDAEWGP